MLCKDAVGSLLGDLFKRIFDIQNIPPLSIVRFISPVAAPETLIGVALV